MRDYTEQIRNCIETSAAVLAQFHPTDAGIVIENAAETAKAVNELAQKDPHMAEFLAEVFDPKRSRIPARLIALGAYCEEVRKENPHG